MMRSMGGIASKFELEKAGESHTNKNQNEFIFGMG